MKIAILDDYQNVALKMADWSVLAERAEITVFNDHVTDPSGVVERLLPFDVICVNAGANTVATRGYSTPSAAKADRLNRFT